jgi:hypothetical protein
MQIAPKEIQENQTLRSQELCRKVKQDIGKNEETEPTRSLCANSEEIQHRCSIGGLE